ILERAVAKGTLIVNKPQNLRDFNEKLFTACFSFLTPVSLFTSNIAQLNTFLEKHLEIILKPLLFLLVSSIFFVNSSVANFVIL
ncbi:glutathione synthase, partial [Escherichia coli]